MKTHRSMKFMPSLSLAFLCLMLGFLSPHRVRGAESSGLRWYQCSGDCQAKQAVKSLQPYALKPQASNPLGSDVCREQLQGKVRKITVRGKKIDVCQFQDQSSVELLGLHLEAEKLVRP
jgi:hypothetical protein